MHTYFIDDVRLAFLTIVHIVDPSLTRREPVFILARAAEDSLADATLRSVSMRDRLGMTKGCDTGALHTHGRLRVQRPDSRMERQRKANGADEGDRGKLKPIHSRTVLRHAIGRFHHRACVESMLTASEQDGE